MNTNKKIKFKKTYPYLSQILGDSLDVSDVGELINSYDYCAHKLYIKYTEIFKVEQSFLKKIYEYCFYFYHLSPNDFLLLTNSDISYKKINNAIINSNNNYNLNFLYDFAQKNNYMNSNCFKFCIYLQKFFNPLILKKKFKQIFSSKKNLIFFNKDYEKIKNFLCINNISHLSYLHLYFIDIAFSSEFKDFIWYSKINEETLSQFLIDSQDKFNLKFE